MLLRVVKTVACVVLLLPACTQDVDDPANFDPSQNMDSGGSADSAGDEGSTAGGSGMVSNGADSSTGAPPPPPPMGDSSSGGPLTGGPAEDSGGAAGCGDGMVSPGEQCDGNNLQGFDCTSLGLGTGSLGCDPVTCTFDTSMCMGGGGTSG